MLGEHITRGSLGGSRSRTTALASSRRFQGQRGRPVPRATPTARGEREVLGGALKCTGAARRGHQMVQASGRGKSEKSPPLASTQQWRSSCARRSPQIVSFGQPMEAFWNDRRLSSLRNVYAYVVCGRWDPGTRVWGLGLGNACSITCSTNRLHGCKRWFSPPFVNRDEFRSRVQCAAAPSAR